MAAACCGMVPRATATGSVRTYIHAASLAPAAPVKAPRLPHPGGAHACCRRITRTQLLLVAAAAGAGASAGWSMGGQLWSAFQGACQTVAAIALLFAALPPLLSTQYGTRTLCAAASRAFPGDVRVKSLSAGWLSPVNIEGLEMMEGRSDDGRRLLAIGRLTTAEPLYQVLFAGNVTLTIAEPSLDMTLDDSGTELRLAKHFKAARLAHILAPPGDSAAAAQGPEEGAAVPAGAGLPADAAAAAAADASSALVPAALNDAPLLTPKAEAAASEALPERSATEIALADAIERGISALRQRLTHADASAGFSLEVRSDSEERRVAVFVSGGQLLVPREIREAVGRHLHGAVALGASEVRALAEEMGDDAGWAAAGVTSSVTSGGSKEARSTLPGGSPDTGKSRDQWEGADGGDGSSSVSANSGSSSGSGGQRPVAIQLDSERVMVDARGWSTPQGLQLQRPLHARVDLTPDFASMTLASFNPLLHDVLSVRDGGRVALSYGPANGRFGAGGGTLRIEPVRLAVAEGRILGPLLRLLNAGGLFGLGGNAWGGLPFLGGGAPRQLEVWTGPMEVELRSDGVCNTRRVDMLLGNRVRLCVWGTVDTYKDTIDMRIGIPASTLASTLKIRGLPSDYMLPLELRGSTLAPVLDINAAARKVAVISAMQLGRAVGAAAIAAGSNGGKGGVSASLSAATAAAPAVLPLVHLGGAVAAASAQFLQQCAAVDGRLQTELGCAAPPAVEPAPWDAAAGGGGAAAGGGGSPGAAASGSGGGSGSGSG